MRLCARRRHDGSQKMTTTLPVTVCERNDNTCPSRNNCHRYTAERRIEFRAASLNSRREAGASACDLYQPIVADLSTFAASEAQP